LKGNEQMMQMVREKKRNTMRDGEQWTRLRCEGNEEVMKGVCSLQNASRAGLDW